MDPAQNETRDELRRRLHEKIRFARTQRTRGTSTQTMPDDDDDDNDIVDNDLVDASSDTTTPKPKTEAARRRARKKKDRKRQRKLAKAYDHGGMGGIMDAMGIKDPSVRDAVQRMTGSAASQIQPGSGAPSQETVDELLARFENMAGDARISSAPSTTAPGERLLLDDVTE